MSDCPGCGEPAEHVGIYVPRRIVNAATIIHECRKEWCDITRFNENLRGDLENVLKDWGRILPSTAPLEAWVQPDKEVPDAE